MVSADSGGEVFARMWQSISRLLLLRCRPLGRKMKCHEQFNIYCCVRARAKMTSGNRLKNDHAFSHKNMFC